VLSGFGRGEKGWQRSAETHSASLVLIKENSSTQLHRSAQEGRYKRLIDDRLRRRARRRRRLPEAVPGTKNERTHERCVARRVAPPIQKKKSTLMTVVFCGRSA